MNIEIRLEDDLLTFGSKSVHVGNYSLVHDAIKYLLDTRFTKEQVEELLKQQRALIIARCRDEFYPDDNQNLQYLMFRNFIECIPSPLGEKK